MSSTYEVTSALRPASRRDSLLADELGATLDYNTEIARYDLLLQARLRLQLSVEHDYCTAAQATGLHLAMGVCSPSGWERRDDAKCEHALTSEPAQLQ